MDKRDRAIVLLLMSTPTRLAELAALKVDDIDLREREGTITRGKGGRPRGWGAIDADEYSAGDDADLLAGDPDAVGLARLVQNIRDRRSGRPACRP